MTVSTPTLDQAFDPTTTYVWYCAFGSNLWSQRFNRYLTGGPVPNSPTGQHQHGSRQQALPLASTVTRLNRFALVFGGNARSWGGGGAAFLVPAASPTPTPAHVVPYGRMWLITAQQFCDVFTQENKMGRGEADDALFPAISRVVAARDSWGAGATSHIAPIVDRSYGRLLHMGFAPIGSTPVGSAPVGHPAPDGLATDPAPGRPATAPILSFSHPEPSSISVATAPSAYLEVMGLGLIEGWGMTPATAAHYLAACTGNGGTIQPHELADRIAAIL